MFKPFINGSITEKLRLKTMLVIKKIDVYKWG